jgi:hypothetical protein
MKINVIKCLSGKVLLLGLLCSSSFANAAGEQYSQEELNLITKQLYINKIVPFLAKATPDGKLAEIYGYTIIIKTCIEIRQDYAIQFISPSEYEKAKNNTKRIESYLKPSLKMSTDEIWNRTIKYLQKFPPSNVDVLESIRNESFDLQKEDCKNNLYYNNKFTELLLGKQSISKDF